MQLRAKSTKGNASFGVDVLKGKVSDLSAENIYEPLAVKELVNAATEAACMILRIDDVIAATKSNPTPSSGNSGMGCMPGMDM